MSLTHIPTALRRSVRLRARGCCEYCLIHEDDVFRSHEADHIVAEQHGGTTTAENLALACWECNRRKGPNLSSVDPETGELVPIFHPRKNHWNDHFRLAGHRIVPLTPVGRATVAALSLNSAARLRIRRGLLSIGRYPV